MSPSRRTLSLAVAFILLLLPSPGSASSGSMVSSALSAYLDGLDALMLGRPGEAVAAFSRALEVAGDDPDFLLARGVAETLAKQFPQAVKDLERASKLGLKGRELELWTYAAEAMSGRIGSSHATGGPRTAQGRHEDPVDPDRGCEWAIPSIPGHVLQGRDDYPSAYASLVIHTTAAPMLRLASARMTKTTWQEAKAFLARGRELDETDPRVPAYLGIILEEEGKTQEAVAAYRTAIALEEAKLQLDEPAVRTGTPLARDLLEFGAVIQARLHLARQCEEAGRKSDALGLYEANLAYELRLPAGFESVQVFTALWPDRKPDKGAAAPSSPNGAALIADCHLRAVRLQKALGRQDEANRHFAGAARYGSQQTAGGPMVGNSKGDPKSGGLGALRSAAKW